MKNPQPSEQGIAKGAIFLLAVIVLIVLYAAIHVLSNPAPTIQPAKAVPGIGLSRTVEFTVHDPRYRITQVGISVVQDGRVFNAPVTVRETHLKGRGFTAEASAEIGRREVPQLEQGRATIRVAACPTAPRAPTIKTDSPARSCAARTKAAHAVVNGTPIAAACSMLKLAGFLERVCMGTVTYSA